MFKAIKVMLGFGRPDTIMQTMQHDPAVIPQDSAWQPDSAAAEAIRQAADDADACREDRNYWRDAAKSALGERDTARAEAKRLGKLCAELLTERDAARDKLREINGMETPSSAPAAKRMARCAREGLPEFIGGTTAIRLTSAEPPKAAADAAEAA